MENYAIYCNNCGQEIATVSMNAEIEELAKSLAYCLVLCPRCKKKVAKISLPLSTTKFMIEL